MSHSKTQPVLMLADLIREASAGKKIVLKTRFINEVIPVKREKLWIETNVLSVEYSGKIEGKPFKIKKNYLFSEDAVRNSLECLLIANNRLQMDYARLKKAGLAVPEEFFTFENTKIKPRPNGSTSRPAYRLQDFILLSRAGVPVSVTLTLKFPELVLNQEGREKKGIAYVAEYAFQTAEGKTKVEKLYGLASDEEPKVHQSEVKAVANKRLERDCERLRRAGIRVKKFLF